MSTEATACIYTILWRFNRCHRGWLEISFLFVQSLTD